MTPSTAPDPDMEWTMTRLDAILPPLDPTAHSLTRHGSSVSLQAREGEGAPYAETAFQPHPSERPAVATPAPEDRLLRDGPQVDHAADGRGDAGAASMLTMPGPLRDRR